MANCLNWLLQDDTNIEVKFNVQQDCSAHWDIPNRIKLFLVWNRPKVWKSDFNINFDSKIYGNVPFQKFVTMKHVIESFPNRKGIELIEKYKTTSKYVWVGLDL